jgi:hypothetical protein
MPSVSDAVILALLMALLSCSCATRRATVTGALPEKEARGPVDTMSDRSRALDKLKRAAQEQIATAQRRRLEEESRIRSVPPYFYKRFELYPSGADELQIRLKETESVLKPYEATVSVPRARFTTEYHTSRSACARDSNFIRDMGTQMDTYVYENGEWNLLYSLFEVEKTSVLHGETWEDVTSNVERIAQDRPESFSAKWVVFSGPSSRPIGVSE